MTTPNKDRIRLLVETLRSGKYRQGKYALNLYDNKAKKRKLCCLGVACEVARLAGLELKITRDSEEYAQGQISYNNEQSLLPDSVKNWFGFGSHDPHLLTEFGDYSSATNLNDFGGYKFRQIADAFERTYLKDTNDVNA